jgi:hydrogenase maturation protease
VTLPAFVGLGSPHGDDQAGWRVIERLRERGVSTNDAVIAYTSADLCHAGNSARPFIVCDAAADGRPAGTISEWHWPEQRLPSRHGGTHDVALGEALSLAVQLGTIPSHVEVWMISGGEFRPLSSPRAEVLAAATRLADQLYERWYHA